jgi:hypothetical protein
MAAPSITVYSDTNNSGTVNLPGAYPTGWTAGKLLVAFVYNRGNTSFATTPTGWNLIGKVESSGASMTHGAWWRISESGDSTTPTWTTAAADNGNVIIVEIDGADSLSPINVSEHITDATGSTSHTVPTDTTTVDDCLVLDFWARAGAESTDTPPGSPWSVAIAGTAWGSSGSARKHGLVEQDKTTAGSVGGESWTSGTVSGRAGQDLVAIAPATGTWEAMRPNTNTGATSTNLSSYDYTTLDDDPDAGGTDFLTGTDPSGVYASITHRSSTPATGTTQTTTTSTTATIPSDVVNGDIMVFTVTNGDATAQPTVSDNSGIGSWTLIQNAAGTAVGVSSWYKRVTNQTTERG